MALNSCLYECDIVHSRLTPKKHRFSNKTFWFCLDISEIDTIAEKIFCVSRNRPNLYAFYDSDHTALPVKKSAADSYTLMLTNLRMFGYVFNPASFYFDFSSAGDPVSVTAEVGNTFGEQKAFHLGPSSLKQGVFCGRQPQHYYISPFIDLDSEIEFRVKPPSDTLDIHIDVYKKNERFFFATVRGRRKELSAQRLVWYAFRYPWMTLGIIMMIHWQALRLWLKKVPYLAKESHPELQREVMIVRKKR